PDGVFNWIDTPDIPASPVSRTPLPLASLNFTPEMLAGAATWLPKRYPVAFWPGVSVMAIPAPPPGSVWTEPEGRTSVRTYGPAESPVKEKLPAVSVVVETTTPTELVRRIVTPETP